MKAYLELCRKILTTGRPRGDRTGTGTTSIFTHTFEHDMRTGFPLLTTKEMHLRGIFEELRAIVRGELHLETLVVEGVKIWDPWRTQEDVKTKRQLANYERIDWMRQNAPEVLDKWERLNVQAKPEVQGHDWLDKHGVPRSADMVTTKAGDLNAPYGPGWRAFQTANGSVDQFAYALDLLRNNPESRRILVNAWNPGWMPDESITPQENIINGKPCLTPCHFCFQFYTEEMTYEERLAWAGTQSDESLDLLVTRLTTEGLSLSIASRQAMLSRANVPVRYLSLKWSQRSVDVHLGLPYNIPSYALLLQTVAGHLNMVPFMLVGDLTNVHIYSDHLDAIKLQLTREPYSLPRLRFKRQHDRIEDYRWQDIVLEGYHSHPAIKGKPSV